MMKNSARMTLQVGASPEAPSCSVHSMLSVSTPKAGQCSPCRPAPSALRLLAGQHARHGCWQVQHARHGCWQV